MPENAASSVPVMINKKKVHHSNITASIEQMVSLGILANNETTTVEAYINTLKPIVEKYNCLVDTRPFVTYDLKISFRKIRKDQKDMLHLPRAEARRRLRQKT